MKQKKKVLFKYFIIIAGFFLSIINVVAVISPTRDFYVNDFAGVLSKETKDYILNNSATLSSKTTAQIVVATVPSLDGENVDQYSLNLIRNWKIGDTNKNNGVLILLAIKEREVKIEVGYGLEGRINDAKAGRFLDEYGVPSFKKNEWDKGIKNLYSALLAEVYEEYDMEIPSEVSNIVSENGLSNEDADIDLMMIIVLCLIFGFGGIFPLIFRRKRRFYDRDHHDPKGGFGGGFFGGGGFPGGGFFGGGGGFSGGGGSGGGGGASRRF